MAGEAGVKWAAFSTQKEIPVGFDNGKALRQMRTAHYEIVRKKRPDVQEGMTRRELLKYAAVSAPLLGASLASGATASQPLPFRNVIVFITDQERYIHFPDGWESQNLPGLTRLKQHGLSFENAFTNACMCSPARSTFFSGYFPAQHGVKYTLEENMKNPKKNPQVELPVELKNVATVMSSVNFNVVYKGKWHCSKPAGSEAVPADLAKYGFLRWNPPDAGANQDPNQAEGGQTVIESDLPHDQRIMFGAPYGQEGAIDYLRSEAPSSTNPSSWSCLW